MKMTKLRRFLPVLLTLLTVMICAIGITAMANEETRTNQISHANIVINDDVDLVFWADISAENAASKETFMTFNDGTPVSSYETKTIDGVTYAIFKYKNIRPQDMANVISAKLFVNGVFTSYIDYSVKDYCQYILNHKSSDALKTLVSDLLVYGAEAQNFTQENLDNIATSGVIGLTASPTPDKIKVLYGTETLNDLARGATASITQSKLLMDNGIKLNFNIDLPSDADISAYTVCMTVNGREQEVKVVSSGYFNRATFNGVYAHELFDNIKINVYKDNVRVSNSTFFSLASYIDALNADPTYTNITNAYYNLSYAAHVYGGSHSIIMPGTITSDDNGSTKYDASGTVTYNCSLCGEEIDSLHITNLRTFDGAQSNGSILNEKNGGSVFTVTTQTETVDGATNRYFSMVRNSTLNKGSGSTDYYFRPDQVRSPDDDFLNEAGEFANNQYTFSFDVKAPTANVAETTFRMQNGNTSGTGRYGTAIVIGSDGSMKYGTAKIADAGTVKTDKWTNVTITWDFYSVNDTHYIYSEFYINGVLVLSQNDTNPMYNHRFNRVYFSINSTGLADGEGIFFDNFMFAQGCVHPFLGSVKDYISKVENGNLRSIVDKVQNEFELDDFSYVVRWKKDTTATYKEYQPFKSMDTTVHPDPESTPKSYSHPRLLFNSYDVPNIVANLEKKENANAKSVFMSYVTTSVDGKLTPTSSFAAGAFEYTNYDTKVFKAIEAKAMYYAIYKDDPTGQITDAKLRGYEAIYAIKNCLLTFDVQWDLSDQCRMYGELAYYSALVYDWCYDLLTADDKLQIMTGVQNLAFDGTSNSPWLGQTHEGRKMEGGFPALAVEDQNALTGHGAEAQVLRDYFSFAVAIFDEDPTWYDYVGGMVYDRYVPARNYFYTSGFYPDGSAGYNCYRYLCDLYNAWIFKSMDVEFPYNAEDMETVVHGLMAMETYDNFQFATADGSGTSWLGQSRIPDNVGDCALISSYLFNDSTALAIAERIIGYRWAQGFSSSQLGTSSVNYLILTANDLVASENYREKIDDIEYHAGFQQQIIARDEYGEDSTVVLMQGAQHLPGGHTHQNAGSFQIWYKGILSRDDGLYDAYGSNHHFYYHMSATAHNTLLIYNNNLKGYPVGPNSSTEYYNGGQKYELGIPVTYENWIKDQKLSFGKNIGVQYDDSYVYFANDITAAYDETTVDYVERSFMTLYTGDDETPMVMFVYDNITADDPSYKKTFLLQCAEAPTIDGNVITVDNGEGKLVLTSLLGNDDIKAYGRTSKDGVVMPEEYFLITDKNGKNPGDSGYITTYKQMLTKDENGKQPGEDGYIETYIPEYGYERFYLSGAGTNLNPGGANMIGDKNSDLGIVWGHVEISPDANQATNQLVNVLYVSDSGTTVSATPVLVQGDYITGATFKNYTSMFVSDPMFSTNKMQFTTTGEGTMTYYIGGVSEGTWKITVNNEFLGEFEATEEGRMLKFDAAPGEVVIEPGDNMRDPNTGLIYYYTNGGTLPEGAPNFYTYGEVTKLPTPTKEGATFEGWFTDKAFKEPISEIPAEARESFRLYAKWTAPIVYADYTKGGTTSDYSQFAYSAESGGGTWKVINGDTNYLLWTLPSGSPGGGIIQKDGSYATYADESLLVSFSLTVGKDGNNPILPTSVYLRDGKYESNSPYRFMNIFKIDGSGNAYLGNTGKPVKFATIPSNGMITLHFTLDFENGKMMAFNENGEEIASVSFGDINVKCPPEYRSYAEWFRNLNGGASNAMFSWKAGSGGGSLRIGMIRIISGRVDTHCRNFGTSSEMHSWDNGVVITDPSKNSCTPGTIRYTCSECNLTKDEAIISETPHSSITAEVNNGKIVYTCVDCGCTYTPTALFYLDGSSHSGIIGVGNADNYATVEGTHQPIINGNGEYELINKTDKDGNLELWVPSKSALASGFASDNDATGFFAFKVNALTDNNFSFNFVDTSSSGAKWSDTWCLTDAFFTISAPKTENGKTTVRVAGWDGVTLKTVEVSSEQSFTGWIDVKIYIELNPDDDTITLHYYIEGEYVASVSKELTTATNAINSVCISGSTGMLSSGIKLDDIVFSYSASGAWVSKK